MVAPSRPVTEGYAVNKTALSPGKICGQRWTIVPDVSSVRGLAVPPDEGILTRAKLQTARIKPSSPQLAPLLRGQSVMRIAGPPLSGIFFSVPSEKNPTHCPSGEKKGALAFSVPCKSIALG